MKNRFSFLVLFLAVILSACSSSNDRSDNTYRRASDDRPLVDEKYSLSADRQAFDEMRAQVPADRRRQNDEMAFILGLMSEVKKSPSDIRSQFDQVLRKKRQQFDKDINKEREIFTKEERRKREAFLKSQQEERTSFNREKHDRETKNQFYKTLDERRSEFFSVERDRRADFEADVRERRKNFEDYAREKQNEFNQELRSYSKRYEEYKKSKDVGPSSGMLKDPRINTEADELERELQEARKRASTPLEAGE